MTSFYLVTQPAPVSVVQWSFSFPNLLASAATATNAFLHIQNFAQNATVIDRKIGFGIHIDSSHTFSVSGTYFGSLTTFNDKVITLIFRIKQLLQN